KMNVEQLKYIVEVAKSGSISSASKNLFVTQSAISQSITQLEKKLNVQIFIRSRQGAELTDIGKKIVSKAFEALDAMEEIKLEAKESKEGMQGNLHLGTIPSPLMHLTKTLASFKNDYPNIAIKVSEMSSDSIVEAILAKEIDLGLVGLSISGEELQNENIETKIILKGKMIVATGKQSKHAFQKQMTIQDILQEQLVIYDDERMWEFIHTYIYPKSEPNILFSTNNTDAIRNAVAEGTAITIAPDYTIYNDPYVLEQKISPLEIAHLKQDYPGMALVWSKSAENKLIHRFINRLETDMLALKELLK